MAGWVDEFTSHLISTGRSENTVKAYLQDIGQFHAWFRRVNGVPLEPGQITNLDLIDYRRYSLDEERVRSATWNRRWASLSVLTSWALERGDLAYDVMEGVRKAKKVAPPPRWLEEKEYRRLMRHIERSVHAATTDYQRWQAIRDRAIISLGVYAGLRVGEIVNLQIEDLAIGERSGMAIVRGKGDKQREVPLNVKCRAALRDWLGIHDDASSFIFFGKHGDPLGVQGIQRRMREIGYETKIEDLTPHVLRHTFGHNLVAAGKPINWIKDLMGHSRLETTMLYTQPGRQDLEDAVEVL